MSTPNEPQDPYAARQPEEPAPPGDPSQKPAAPQYPSAPSYGYPPPDPSGYPPAPQYGAGPGYPPAPQYGAGPGYPPAPQYGAAPGYAGVNAFPKNSLAVWSLVLAILGMVLCGLLTGIPAVILGSKAKRAVAAGEANNGGVATAGVIVGWIAIVLSLIGAIAIGFLIANGSNWSDYTNSSAGTGY